MEILVTGGAGFIGKYLVKFLLDKGHKVTIFDNFSNSKKEDLFSIVNLGAKIIEGDIRNQNSINEASKNKNLIIHLAAKISVVESISNPKETFEVNVDGTRNVLLACKKNNIKKIIAASSAAIYGQNSEKIKLTENSQINPISPYGESKTRMEEEIREFTKKNNCVGIILRFFNIYGIGQSEEYAGVISKFLQKIFENEPIQIFGDGSQTRDFIYVEDVVNSIYIALFYEKNETFNIASGKAITINKLAEKIISISGKKIKIIHLEQKKGEIKYSHADISKAREMLNFLPRFNLDKIQELFFDIK